MTFDEARDVMYGIFKAAWDVTGYTALYTDVPGEVPTEGVWARVTLKHAVGHQASLAGDQSKRRWTRQGTIFIQVFGPVGDGKFKAYRAAQRVVNAYQTSRDPNVWFRDVRINEVGSDGAFQQINVMATFIYDDVE